MNCLICFFNGLAVSCFIEIVYNPSVLVLMIWFKDALKDIALDFVLLVLKVCIAYLLRIATIDILLSVRSYSLKLKVSYSIIF